MNEEERNILGGLKEEAKIRNDERLEENREKGIL